MNYLNTVDRPGTDIYLINEPDCIHKYLQMLKPKPVPSKFSFFWSVSFTQNILFISVSLIPIPLSITSNIYYLFLSS